MTKEEIIEALKEVHHPGRSDKDIVSLGMVQSVEGTSRKAASRPDASSDGIRRIR